MRPILPLILFFGTAGNMFGETEQSAGPLRRFFRPGGDSALRDWYLHTQARRALDRDERLRHVHIGVCVEHGKAWVYGPLSDAALIAHAQALVKQATGLPEVANRCTGEGFPRPPIASSRRSVEPPSGPPTWGFGGEPVVPLVLLPGEPEGPPQTVAELAPVLPPRRSYPSASAGYSTKVTITPAPGTPIRMPAGVVLHPAQPIETIRAGPITPNAGTILTTVARPPSVPEKLESMCREGNRFPQVYVEFTDGVVRLYGYSTRMNEVWALANRMEEVAGVERVVVNVTTPHRR